jgi:hypothetical protein
MERALAVAAISRRIEGDAMAKRTTTTTSSSQAKGSAAGPASGGESAEDRFIALAEQLGRIVGTMQAKAGGWLDREALTQQIAQVRDGATHLLEQLGVSAVAQGTNESGSGQQPSAPRQETSRLAANRSQQPNTRRAAAGGRSGGVGDAPGKKHRKPVPNQVQATAADADRVAKNKVVNTNRRRGR